MGTSRLNISLTPEACHAIDTALFALRTARVRVSTSALVEAAVLELVERNGNDADALATVVRKHVGRYTARRRTLDQWRTSFYAAITTLADPRGELVGQLMSDGALRLGNFVFEITQTFSDIALTWTEITGNSTISENTGQRSIRLADDPLEVAAEVDSSIRRVAQVAAN